MGAVAFGGQVVAADRVRNLLYGVVLSAGLATTMMYGRLSMLSLLHQSRAFGSTCRIMYVEVFLYSKHSGSAESVG